ncbi:unnamed protein product [Sphenostylis stenocarpa]|uniref:Uncharacterized protein n=1 Tax=Sphenostylis stenocarpa TaxID=92480 RepID=A0AA86VQL2_9FABA|nr:unnamed protein product [Sphenostylis stenocarpa]
MFKKVHNSTGSAHYRFESRVQLKVAIVGVEIRSKENIRGTWGFNVAFTKDAIIHDHVLFLKCSCMAPLIILRNRFVRICYFDSSNAH